MRDELRELWRFRELLLSLVERELRIRYKNSVLGFFWSLLNPLLTVGVMTVVFKYFLNQSVSSYVLYVLAAYLPYMFYQLAILDSSQSVLSALPMVKKVYFPREVLPLAQILANGVHFCLALVVFFAIAVLVWIRHPGQFPIQPTVVYLPLLIVIQMMLTMGLGFLVSALNTFYEDVKYVVNAILYMGFFLTPVMYFSENVFEALYHRGAVGQALYYLYHLNPIATLCTAYKKILLAPTPIPGARGQVEALPLDWGMLGITAALSFFILVFGYHTFNRLKWGFVERP